MDTYLIAHVPRRHIATANEPVGLIAQAEIPAKSELDARREFAQLFPKRDVTSVGVKGADD